MKTTITIYHPMVSALDKITYADKRVVMAWCKSVPHHYMDCERCVHTTFWSIEKTFVEALPAFISRLKSIYEDENLEVEIIDDRQTHLPHKDMY
jgi:aromatic ring-opening dioxygenase LigB subunit